LGDRLDFWVRNVDCLIPSTMGPDGVGRWDVLIPNMGFLDLDVWRISSKDKNAKGPFIVAHSPNHRGVKGTEFLIAAIEELQDEGYAIELRLLEGLKNDEVRRILQEEVDLLVEAIIGPGHGLSALEGMASGLPVISNLDFEEHFLPFRRWSFFAECPLISASPETIKNVLIQMLDNEVDTEEIARLSRSYVEKYYGIDSAVFLFTRMIQYVMGERDSLINLYHPLLGEHPGLGDPLKVPLDLNRIRNRAEDGNK